MSQAVISQYHNPAYQVAEMIHTPAAACFILGGLIRAVQDQHSPASNKHQAAGGLAIQTNK